MGIIDKLKAWLAFVLVAAGVVGFYMLPEGQNIAAFAGGIVLAIVVLWFSAPGRNFVVYARDSVREAQKVVWPNRRETWQTTAMVFAFVAVLSLFMWLVDSGLTWIMYELLLGTK